MYRTIQTETWDDPWFADLAPSAKLLFLFLITNRRVSQCGAMEITMRQISFETGLSPATIPALLESFGDRIRWWPDHQILIIRNFYRHQRANTGEKFDIAATRSAELLPDFAKAWVYGVYPHLAPNGYTHPIPTPVPPDTDGVSEQDSNKTKTEAEQSTPPPPKGEHRKSTSTKPFVMPDDFTLTDERIAYAENKGMARAAIENLFEEMRLWSRMKGGKYLDWDAAWQTWVRRRIDESPPNVQPIRPPVSIASKPQLPPVMQPGSVPPDGGLAAWRSGNTGG